MSREGKPLVVWVCDACGSTDVMCDAWASFDVESQRWELHSTCDAAHCEACGGEARTSERMLSPEEHRRIVEGDDIADVLKPA